MAMKLSCNFQILPIAFLQHGSTPIHIAAKFGHTELISKFAAAGVNLRQVSRKTGLSALHVASFYGMEGKIIAT